MVCNIYAVNCHDYFEGFSTRMFKMSKYTDINILSSVTIRMKKKELVINIYRSLFVKYSKLPNGKKVDCNESLN